MSNLTTVIQEAELLLSKLREAQNIVNRMVQDSDSHEIKLTESEERIFRKLKDGFDLEEISQQQKISIRTVEVHRSHIMKKLGFKKAKEFYKSLRNAMRS